MRRAMPLLWILSVGGCGPDMGAAQDFAARHDFSVADLAVRLDLGSDQDLSTIDLGCGCSLNPPASQCQKNVVVSYSTPGACVADPDAGERCSYPRSTNVCTNGCFNATCASALSFLGNTLAFITGTATMVTPLTNGMVAAGSQVTITTQTYPPGSASDVHLVFTKSTDPGFAMATDLQMTYDKYTMNNDQWYAIVPAQLAGTTTVWYLYADGYGLSAPVYYSNFGNNFRYTSN